VKLLLYPAGTPMSKVPGERQEWKVQPLDIHSRSA